MTAELHHSETQLELNTENYMLIHLCNFNPIYVSYFNLEAIEDFKNTVHQHPLCVISTLSYWYHIPEKLPELESFSWELFLEKSKSKSCHCISLTHTCAWHHIFLTYAIEILFNQ